MQSVFEVIVGGGMGRTPVIGKSLHLALPGTQLLAYLQSIIRIYNLYGRRDNKYKSRIKILVNELGIEKFRELVERDFSLTDPKLFESSIDELPVLRGVFKINPVLPAPKRPSSIAVRCKDYSQWLSQNVIKHQYPNYRIVMVSLKRAGIAPGDMDSLQMKNLASIAEEFGIDQIRVSHDQNLVLPWVLQTDLFDIWQQLKTNGLASPNIATIRNMICYPGLDFCSLANACTIPLAHELNTQLDKFVEVHDLGPISLKMSGCMNACGHHHLGDIGILGVDKKGQQWYQVTLGGRAGDYPVLGERLGPAIHRDEIIQALITILHTYLDFRITNESFNQSVHRTGITAYKQNVYINKLAA